MKSSQSNSERRREKRFEANGDVMLLFDDPAPQEIKGRLFDYSQSGFRAAHDRTLMRAGQEVRFRFDKAEGRARVVWNRILPQYVESGFIILESY